MQELLKNLIDNAGLTEDQAKKSIEIMKEFVHSKVPPMFSSVVDGFFADNSAASGSDGLI